MRAHFCFQKQGRSGHGRRKGQALRMARRAAIHRAIRRSLSTLDLNRMGTGGLLLRLPMVCRYALRMLSFISVARHDALRMGTCRQQRARSRAQQSYDSRYGEKAHHSTLRIYAGG